MGLTNVGRAAILKVKDSGRQTEPDRQQAISRETTEREPTVGDVRSRNALRLFEEVQKGGEVRITTVNQADGPYIICAGLGIHVGGYRTVDEAVAAWIDSLDYDRAVAQLDNEGG